MLMVFAEISDNQQSTTNATGQRCLASNKVTLGSGCGSCFIKHAVSHPQAKPLTLPEKQAKHYVVVRKSMFLCYVTKSFTLKLPNWVHNVDFFPMTRVFVNIMQKVTKN